MRSWVGALKNNFVIANILGALSLMLEDRVTLIALLWLVFVLFLGVAGPTLAPYEADELMFDEESGQLLTNEPPSLSHPLGTTSGGKDVFSRILVGARPTVMTGLIGGTIIVSIGAAIGVTAGYMGGWVDNVLMRFTDIVYGVPVIPFAIVIVGFFGIGYLQSVVIIGAMLWRGAARVLRSQVLQIRERPFIRSSRATGASQFRIVTRHILPNIGTMIVLYFSLGIGFSILIQAGLAFIGIADPFVPSWGIMVQNAYNSGLMAESLWWSLPPGFLISFTVMFAFLFGRGYESVVGQTDEEALTEAG